MRIDATVVSALLIAWSVLFVFAVYLTVRLRESLTGTRNFLRDVQMEWERVVAQNTQAVALAVKSGNVLPESPRERTYREWGER